MRSKRTLKPVDSDSPFADWDDFSDRLARRSLATDDPSPQPPAPPHAARTVKPTDREVLWDRMIVGWLLLGIKAGTVVGALLGLFAGPAGFFIGAIIGACAGGFLALPVLGQALLIYGLRHLTGRPPHTTGQHIRIFLILPAVLLAVPILVSPESAIITGPPLATGLIFGPGVVKRSLRPVPSANPAPPDVFDDSPRR